MNPLSLLDGWKSYIAGVGLIGLGIYECSTHEIEKGLQSIGEGLGLLGLRRAMTTTAASAPAVVPVLVVEPPTP